MEQNIAQIIIAVLTSVLASSGMWAYIIRRMDKKDVKTDMLLGLGHDRIVSLGMRYIDRGYITQDEYENLYNYLYQPYLAMHGNGSAKRIMNEVDKLEIRKGTFYQKEETKNETK